MQFADNFKKTILSINDETFESSSLEVFKYQFHECDVYNKYSNSIGKNPNNVRSIHQIPFLPIEFFKNHAIKSGKWEEQKIFKSSGTTKTGRSLHYVKDLKFYKSMAKWSFEETIGSLAELQVLALLPSYQQQGSSSLVEMVDHFMKSSRLGSNYFELKSDELSKKLSNTETKKLLIGVSYALLDLTEQYFEPLENVLILETGGMKGRRKELTREELHEKLKKSFNQVSIYSEYGMTELMSQAYGKSGEFRFPKWAKVLIREINDPFCYVTKKTGGINVIDLANVDSCSFIETKDLGRITNESFEVLGRIDNSDVRGCNLMIQRNM